MANIYGRQVVLPLTNKSGGGVVAGDVVIIDTGNDGAFTTTTSGQYQGSVGVAQETIANNATGRVLVAGYAALVNVPSSMTRGRFLQTHTVAKQATGNATRQAGSFGQFLTGGTTPTAWLWGFPDNAGAAGETLATSTLWDAAGDLVQGTGADTAAKLSAGAAGTVLTANGAAAALTWGSKFPTFDYAEVATDESTTSGSFTDLATTGPAVTITVNTKAKVTLSADMYGAVGCNMGVAISGASTVAASEQKKLFQYEPTSNGGQKSRVIYFSGLTPGSTTFTAKYYSGSAGTAVHFRYRSILVECLD